MTPLVLTLLVALGLSFSPASGNRLPHIVNGRDAKVGEFPWQASLQLFGGHSCGAALVTDRWLVTAAHCISFVSFMTIVLGAHDIKTLEKGKPQTFEVDSKKTIAHPDFHFELDDPDIGLVYLTTAATLDGTYVDTIKLAPSDVGSLAGAECVITGWGNTKVGSTHPPNILQAASTTPLTYDACEKLITDMPNGGAGIINDGNICIGSTSLEGSCHGDSGGPLVCKANGTQVLAGVTSWGNPECSVKYPSIYTRISYFRKWLSDNSGGEV